MYLGIYLWAGMESDMGSFVEKRVRLLNSMSRRYLVDRFYSKGLFFMFFFIVVINILLCHSLLIEILIIYKAHSHNYLYSPETFPWAKWQMPFLCILVKILVSVERQSQSRELGGILQSKSFVLCSWCLRSNLYFTRSYVLSSTNSSYVFSESLLKFFVE